MKALEELPKEETAPEKEQLLQELADVTARFDRLIKVSEERKKKIEDVEPLAKDYNDTTSKIVDLNKEIEKMLCEKRKPTDLNSLEKELEQAKVIVVYEPNVVAHGSLLSFISWMFYRPLFRGLK